MTLVADLRELIGAGTADYTHGGITFWTDEQLGARLEAHRRYFNEVQIEFLRATGPGNVPVYTKGRIDVNGVLEPGSAGGGSVATLTDGMGIVVAGGTVARDGWVDFGTADQGGSARYLTGWAYDLYAAAADVLEAWASHVKLGYDFTTDGQTFNRSQKHKMLYEQAETFRAKAIPHEIPIVTTEFAPDEYAHRRGR